MTSVPTHYRRFYVTFMRFAIVMMIFGLLMGITFQESSKKAPVSAILPPGMHLESVIDLALSHGHIFLIGALIPLAMTWMLSLALSLGFSPVSERSLKWGSRLYLPGAIAAIVLMIYKGYHYVLGVRGGQLNFETLHHTFFWGSHVARGLAYGLSHTAMAVGLGIIVISLWRTLKTEK